MENVADFSLILGGPLYQLFLRTQLSRTHLELLYRRIVFFPFLTWVPPMLMTLTAGTFTSGVDIPFCHDIVTHVRFLVAIPMFLAAEVVVHQRLMPMVEQFKIREIVAPRD